jgi:3-phenylpropionate/trans-cinnamate dioxygenase ferredoxin reductase subunit
MPDTVVVIGASLAGMNAAAALRSHGFEGALHVVDADSHRPYDRPPLSKQILTGEWDSERIVLAPARDDALDIEWHLGCRATALDVASRSVTLDDGTVLRYDGCVVATGASARRLPDTEGIGGVHVVRTLDDALAVRAALAAGPNRVVVIGAGFIGAEAAASARGLGLDVTLLEALPVPLERALGPDMGAVMAELHRDHDVDLRLGVHIDGFEAVDGHVRAVHLGDGSVISTELVVVGIGLVLNTGWLEGSGLTLDNGVVTDNTLLAAPGVVAAGDVARWPSARYGELLRVEHWENAIAMGEAAGVRLLAGDEPGVVYDPVPWFWSDQYDRKIQLAGRAGAGDQVEVVIGSTDERRFVALYGREGKVIGVLGMNRPRHVMQLRHLAAEQTPWVEGLAAARALA